MEDLLRYHFLRKNNIVDSEQNAVLNELTHLASQLFKCEFATVSIVDTDRIWFKSICGLNITEIPLEKGLCGTAFKLDQPHIINDTLLDESANQNSLVNSSPHIRSYLAAPLAMHGVSFGTLAVFSSKTNNFSKEDGLRVADLAKMVVGLFEQEMKYNARLALQKDQIELFRHFLDASTDSISFIDSEFRFKYTNQAAKDLSREAFGRSPEKGDYFFDYITPQSREVYKLMLKQVFSGQRIDVERPILGIHHRVYISPVQNFIGEIIGAMFLLQNTHDKVLANKALKENIEYLNQLAWNQSHEIRKPLANILGLVDIIDKLPNKSEKLEKLTKNLRLAGQELDVFLRKNAKNLEQKLSQ